MPVNPLLQTLYKNIEDLVDAKITERFTLNPIHVDTQTVSFEQFENVYMMKHDGDEYLTQGFFRNFLRWMEQYYGYHLEEDANVIRAGVKIEHMTTGEYTAPDESIYTGLPSVLDELFGRIAAIDLAALAGRVSSLETNMAALLGRMTTAEGNITSLSSNLAAHIANSTAHLAADGLSIIAGDSLSVSESWVRGRISASAPLTYLNGVLALSIDPNTLSVNGGALSVIGGGGGGGAYGLAYNTTTRILSLVPNGGTPTVDLSSLLSGSVDLSNFIKKTGETTQTIQGNIVVTGTITAGGEITAFGS